MYSQKKLVILDADGTSIDAFNAIEKTFSVHDMDIGDLERFQKRHKLFKYLGGIKEFPKNIKNQLGKTKRKALLETLTEVYRQEAKLYPGIAKMIQCLIEHSQVNLGIVTRNITHEPVETLKMLLKRENIDPEGMDFLIHARLSEEKTPHFKSIRKKFKINPAKSYACGDEMKDYFSAIQSGMHPLMVSYGFEDYERLTKKFMIPEEVISKTPKELIIRLYNALDFIDE